MNAPVAAARARDAAAGARPVLRERGQREVFCGLTGIVWLHRKIQDAFFLVVGSRTCAHLIQSAAGVMIFAEPRFATAIIDERDLAGLADANDELDRVVDAAARRAGPTSGCCSSSAPARPRSSSSTCRAPPQRLSQRFSPARARAELFRQRHRDDLHAGRGRLPRRAGAGAAGRAADAEPSLLVVGALADVVEDQFARHLRRARHRPACASCRRAARDRPAAGRPEHALPAGAAVPRPTPRARWKSAAPTRLPAPFPLGVEGTTRWLQAAADAFGVDAGALRSASPRRARARADARARRATATQLAGKRIFFFPDSQLEIPLARFLSRELGMELVEVGTPYLHRAASGAGARAAAGRHAASAKARTSTASSTAAARRARTSSSAASASPIRWRPKASRPNGRSSSSSRRSRATSRPAISPNCSPARSSGATRLVA